MKNKLSQKQKDELRQKVYSINNHLINTLLNLYLDENGYIRTVEDDSYIQIKNRYVKLFKISKNDIPFRPIYNSKLMVMLFGRFTNILKEEGRILEYWQYGPGSLRKDKVYLACKEKGYDEVISKPYHSDSLRFYDVMCQLNETEPLFDLEQLDELLSI